MKHFLKYFLLLIVLANCDMFKPISQKERIFLFINDLNKSSAQRQSTNFQRHFHPDSKGYDLIGLSTFPDMLETTFLCSYYRPYSIEFENQVFLKSGIVRLNMTLYRTEGMGEFKGYIDIKRDTMQNWYIFYINFCGAEII